MAPIRRDSAGGCAAAKLCVAAGERIELAGDLGTGLRRELRQTVGRGFVRSGELDGALAAVDSLEQARATLARYRPRLRDSGYLWLVTSKAGFGGRQLEQVLLASLARRLGLIDNKTCSLDEGRSAIRFVVPRAARSADSSRSAA